MGKRETGFNNRPSKISTIIFIRINWNRGITHNKKKGYKTLGFRWYAKCIARWISSSWVIGSQLRNPQRFILPNSCWL